MVRRGDSKTQYLYPFGAADFLKSFLILLFSGRRTLSTCISIVRSSEEPTIKSKLRLLGFALLGVSLGQRLKALGINHVHVHSCGNAATIAMFAKIVCGTSYSLTLHNPIFVYGTDQRFKWRHAAFGVVITHWILDDLKLRYGTFLPAKLGIAPMGVDTHVFRREAPYLPFSPAATAQLFCCARLNLAKGYLELINAVGLLRERGFATQLTIAGEDDAGGNGYRQVLEKEVARLGLHDCIVFLGAVAEDKVMQQLSRAHVFVLASHEEPLGVSIMEAMSMGVPVVATDAGGVPELIDDGIDGVLVPPRNAEAIADGVIKYLSSGDFATQISRAARAKSEQKFSYKTSAQMLKDLLLSERASG